MAIQVVILAAGQGKRMQSTLPKVLHLLAGRSMIEQVVQTAQRVASERLPIVVYGHQGQILQEALSHLKVRWVEQKEQKGTGHALLQALPEINEKDQVLVLYGDVPLISEQTLKQLIEITPANAMGMLTARLPNPAGYGRIKRDAKQQIIGIVEEKDATANERDISEINPGIYLVSAASLKKWLPDLKNNNAQQEYYLTDIIHHAVREKLKVAHIEPVVAEEILGVNDRVQLAVLERLYQKRMVETFMRQGVTIYDPARVDIRGDVQIGRDVVLDVNVILEGTVVIGDECVIGPNTLLKDVRLGHRVEIKANSVIEGAEIASDCIIGPFARLRPGTVLASSAHIGNFVEIKNSTVGEASKINHLSYVGDSDVGRRVNIGAGTITCNYDGARKHKTVIEDDVHVGSDTQLVAPVIIGSGATIAAGSTVTKDVPPNALTLTHRIDQRTKKDWVRPVKE